MAKQAVRGLKVAATREFLAKNPEAKPKEVLEALRKKNIIISPATASNYCYSVKREKSGKGKTTKSGVASLVRDGKQFLNACGSLSEAVQILKTLSELSGG